MDQLLLPSQHSLSGLTAASGSRAQMPPKTKCVDHEQRPSPDSFLFQRRALFEPDKASREFPFKPFSAERRELDPCADLGRGPAAAQAPPRPRVETADVDAWGLRAFCPPFHE